MLITFLLAGILAYLVWGTTGLAVVGVAAGICVAVMLYGMFSD